MLCDGWSRRNNLPPSFEELDCLFVPLCGRKTFECAQVPGLARGRIAFAGNKADTRPTSIFES
jgi:hypothetical protein